MTVETFYISRSLTGQIAKKVLDDLPPDRKTKWAPSRGVHCLPSPAAKPVKDNKPLNLVIHLSKSFLPSLPDHFRGRFTR